MSIKSTAPKYKLCIGLICFCLFSLKGWSQSPNNKYQYPDFNGRVMAGYQGWFNTGSDGAERGWHHYERRSKFAPGSSEIDYWPDMREYKIKYPTDFKLSNGQTAQVFSSYDASTVNLHFKWMKQYGIDGVFMQRFIAEIRNVSGMRHFNHVLSSAMSASRQYKRDICIMYDLSGMQPGEELFLLKDLDRLTKQYGLLETGGKTSPYYLHYRHKPLIAVWGVGFNDHRAYGFKQARIIIDGLKKRGFSIMLGVPTYWRELGSDAIKDTTLHALLADCDIVAPWFVGRYDQKSYPLFKHLIQEDIAWCNAHHLGYVPLAFPGFSWKNMNGPNSRQIARNRGAFFWQQIAGAKQAGAKMLYIAMFDEMNEGTSIFKVATKSGVPGNGDGSFHGIDDDLGSDYYLWLTGQARRWFGGTDPKAYSDALPQRK